MRVSVRTCIKVLYWNLIAGVVLVGLGGAFILRQSHEIDRLVIANSRLHSLDPRLVSAVIDVESRFDPYAVSDADAIGLMQMTWPMAEAWAEAVGEENLTRNDMFEPERNIRAGVWLLAHARDYWQDREDPLPYMLAEYIAGRANAIRWAEETDGVKDFWEAIPSSVVQKYIRDILEQYRGGI